MMFEISAWKYVKTTIIVDRYKLERDTL